MKCIARPLRILLPLLALALADLDWKPRILTNESYAHLFEPLHSVISVLAPTEFPRPTYKLGENGTIAVKPTNGTHRRDADAILAYAEGYELHYYMQFLETLQETGYRGDVVLAIAEDRIVEPDVIDYLSTFVDGHLHDKPNLIFYQLSLDCENEDPTNHERKKNKPGATDIFQFCKLHDIYGIVDARGEVVPAPDPRPPRVVATLRYEYYWIWCQQYSPFSWIMLVDARDSYFQSNPFVSLPRETDLSRTDGLLYFFGENTNATRLGSSTKNLKWLRNGYGEATLQALSEKPTICSGSTMGHTIAIETYLRALINEDDEADTRMTGSDQGFHNYLYYSQKLAHARTIRKLIVWEQGRAMINNLGALRVKTLEEWGMYNPVTHEIYNWDGTLSPVVHQWDRDKALFQSMMRRHRLWKSEWANRKAAKLRKEKIEKMAEINSKKLLPMRVEMDQEDMARKKLGRIMS